MKSYSLVVNVIACLVISLALALSISLILFHYYNIDLGDAWTFTGSVFGGCATLAAAYIASSFYSDWRLSHNKKVDSDFVMRFYDDLFLLKLQAYKILNTLGEFLELSHDEKINKHCEMINEYQKLKDLIDLTSIKLPDLSIIISEDDYDKVFKNRIDELVEKLEAIESIYEKLIDAYDPSAKSTKNFPEHIITNLLEQLIWMKPDLYNHYRSFMVELKKYYKA